MYVLWIGTGNDDFCRKILLDNWHKIMAIYGHFFWSWKRRTKKKKEKRNGVIETAKEMLKKKLSIDLVCEINKLTKEEVEKIK